MRKWGVVVSLIYCLIVLVILVPLGVLLGGDYGLLSPWFYRDVRASYSEWMLWIPLLMLLAGQAALLFLSVNRSEWRLKPRAPVVRSAAVAGMLFMIISVGTLGSLAVAIWSDKVFDKIGGVTALCIFAGLWAGWGLTFYAYLRRKMGVTTRVVNWLLRGSVLELLVAVPCHVVVRRRHDCSAPVATSFGITTGIAIMLLSFGPGVLLLYKKRLEQYRTARAERSAPVP